MKSNRKKLHCLQKFWFSWEGDKIAPFNVNIHYINVVGLEILTYGGGNLPSLSLMPFSLCSKIDAACRIQKEIRVNV